MRRAQYSLFALLLVGCSSSAGQPHKGAKIYTDRANAPSIEAYGIDQVENIEAAKWQSAKGSGGIVHKNYLPIIRVPVESKRNIDGWAIFTFTVSEQGTTKEITLVDEEPKGKFSKDAVRAISKFKYRPYSPAGTPKKVRNVWHIFEFKNTERIAKHDCSGGDEEVFKGKKTGLNQEKYLAMSKGERNIICTKLTKIYEDMISSDCLIEFNAATRETSCASGKRLEGDIERQKYECQFACQP